MQDLPHSRALTVAVNNNGRSNSSVTSGSRSSNTAARVVQQPVQQETQQYEQRAAGRTAATKMEIPLKGEGNNDFTAAEEQREDLADDLHYAARCGDLQEVREALVALEKFQQATKPHNCCRCSSCSSGSAHVRRISGSSPGAQRSSSSSSVSSGCSSSSSSHSGGPGSSSSSTDSNWQAKLQKQQQPLLGRVCYCCCCSPVNVRDSRGGLTALHMAAANGHVAVAEYLIAAGAQHLANNSGNTPLHWAVTNKHAAMVKLLLGSSSAAAPPVTAPPPVALAPAAARAAPAASSCDVGVSAALLAGESFVSCGDCSSGSAAASGAEEEEQQQQQQGSLQHEGERRRPAFVVDVLQRNSVGRSALSEGFNSGDAEILQLLLEHPSAQQLEEAYDPMFQAKRHKPMSPDTAPPHTGSSSKTCSISSSKDSNKKKSSTSRNGGTSSSKSATESGSLSAESPSSSSKGSGDTHVVSSANTDQADLAAVAGASPPLAAAAGNASERGSRTGSSSRRNENSSSRSGSDNNNVGEGSLCSCAAESYVVQSVVHELRLGGNVEDACLWDALLQQQHQQQQAKEEKRECGEGVSQQPSLCGEDGFDAGPGRSRRQRSTSSSSGGENTCSHRRRSSVRSSSRSRSRSSSREIGGACSCCGGKSVFVREVGLSWTGNPFEGDAAAGDTTGVHLWTAAVVGSQWMAVLARRGEFSNKNVLEVGAGCGLLGMAAAVFSAAPLKKLLLTDVFPHALDNLEVGLQLNNLVSNRSVVCSSNASTGRSSSNTTTPTSSSNSVKSSNGSSETSSVGSCSSNKRDSGNYSNSGSSNGSRNGSSNVQVNGGHGTPRNCSKGGTCPRSRAPLEAGVVAFDWGTQPSSWPEGWRGGWDVVVGSDLVYEHRTVEPLAAAVAQLLQKPLGVFYYVHRLERQGAHSFVDALRQHGLSCEVKKAPDAFFVNPFADKKEDDVELCLPELRHRDFELVRCSWHR